MGSPPPPRFNLASFQQLLSRELGQEAANDVVTDWLEARSQPSPVPRLQSKLSFASLPSIVRDATPLAQSPISAINTNNINNNIAQPLDSASLPQGLLHVTVAAGASASMKALLELKCDVNALEVSGAQRTPLHVAVMHGHSTLVRELVAACADVRISDSNGLTAKRLAKKHKTIELCAQYLTLPFYAHCVLERSHQSGATHVSLSRCKLRDFPAQSVLQMRELTHLTALDLSRNKLRYLPPSIGLLTSLQSLNIAQNDISELPATMANLLDLTELDVSDNPLVIPPKAIAKRGAKDVLVYLAELLRSSTNQWLEVRVMCVGAENVGKSTLLRCLASAASSSAASSSPSNSFSTAGPLSPSPPPPSSLPSSGSKKVVSRVSFQSIALDGRESSSAIERNTSFRTDSTNSLNGSTSGGSGSGSGNSSNSNSNSSGSSEVFRPAAVNLSTDGIDLVEWTMQGAITRQQARNNQRNFRVVQLGSSLYNTNNDGEPSGSSSHLVTDLQNIDMIAEQMQQSVIIKDRTYNFRVYKQCFLGRDAVDWLVANTNATNRDEALILGRKMVSRGLISHVANEHTLKDRKLFYRFTNANTDSDDSSSNSAKFKQRTHLMTNEELIKTCIKMTKEIDIRNRRYHLRTYKKCFLGVDAVNWLFNNTNVTTREEALKLGQAMVELKLIQHVVRDHTLKDAKLFYRVSEDLPRILAEHTFGDCESSSSSSTSSSGSLSASERTLVSHPSISSITNSTGIADLPDIAARMCRALSQLRSASMNISRSTRFPRSAAKEWLMSSTEFTTVAEAEMQLAQMVDDGLLEVIDSDSLMPSPFLTSNAAIANLAQTSTQAKHGIHLEEDIKQINKIFNKFKREIPIKDRTYHLRTYKQCFLGNEAVDWLLFNTNALDREEALAIGQEMMARGYIRHVCNDHILKDQKLFYVLSDTEQETVSVKFRGWDFAGQEIYYTTHQFFMSEDALYVVVWDPRQPLEHARIDYWLASITAKAPEAPIILVATHRDAPEFALSMTALENRLLEVQDRYLSRFPKIRSITAVSCVSQLGIDNLASELVSIALQKLSSAAKWPAKLKYLDACIRAEKHAGLLPPVLNWEQFSLLCGAVQLHDEDKIAEMVQTLTSLGTIMYSPEIDRDLVIVDPQWLADCMATVITTKQNFVIDGVLQHSKLPLIWRPPKYPPTLHAFLLQLMYKYEAAFPLSSDADADNTNTSATAITIANINSPDNTPSVLDTTDEPYSPLSLSRSNGSVGISSSPSRIRSFSQSTASWRYGSLSNNTSSSSVSLSPSRINFESSFKVNSSFLNGHDNTDVLVAPLKGSSLFPCLLPLEQPANLASIWPLNNRCDQLQVLRLYHLNYIPIGFFNRFLVRILKFVDRSLAYWRSGAVLELRHATARIDMLPSNSSIGIELRAMQDGFEDLIKLLRITLQTVESLCSYWFHLDTTEFIPCSHCLAVLAGCLPDIAPAPLSSSSPPPTPLLVHLTLNSAKKSSITTEERLPFIHHAVHLFRATDCDSAVASQDPIIQCPLHGGCAIPVGSIAPDIALADIDDLRIDAAERLEFGAQLGIGAFGSVNRAVLDNKTQVAVKRIISISNEAVIAFRHEVWLMAQLKHPNLVRMHGFSTEPLLIVMELVEGGDLYGFLHNPAMPKLTWEQRIRIALEISDGMSYLHAITPPILHRDLKTPNILLTAASGDGTIKITDFGLSCKLYNGSVKEVTAARDVQTPTWLAPEVISENSYTEKADCYAMGIMMWELLTNQHPFEEYNFRFSYELERAILAGTRPSIPSEYQVKRAYGIHKNPELLAADKFVTLMQQCWNAEPDQRPSFATLASELRQLQDRLLPHTPSRTVSLEDEYPLDCDELLSDYSPITVARLRAPLVTMAAFEDVVAVACSDRSVSIYNPAGHLIHTHMLPGIPRLLFRRKRVVYAVFGDTVVSLAGSFVTTVCSVPFKIDAAVPLTDSLLLIDPANNLHQLCLRSFQVLRTLSLGPDVEQHLRKKYHPCLAVDQDGVSIWVATRTNRLLCIDIERFKVLCNVAIGQRQAVSKLYLTRNHVLICFTSGNLIVPFSVFKCSFGIELQVSFEVNGCAVVGEHLWVFGDGDRIAQYDLETLQPAASHSPNGLQNILVVEEVPRTGVWIGAPMALSLWHMMDDIAESE